MTPTAVATIIALTSWPTAGYAIWYARRARQSQRRTEQHLERARESHLRTLETIEQMQALRGRHR